MDRRSVLGGLGTIGIAVAGCIGFDTDGEWETVEDCTEETAIRVESIGAALEEWADSPEEFDTTRFEDLAEETAETLEDCESEVGDYYDEIEDETIVPTDELDDSDGEEILAAIDALFETANKGQEAATAVEDADGDPDALGDEQAATAESVREEYGDVLEAVEPVLPEDTEVDL